MVGKHRSSTTRDSMIIGHEIARCDVEGSQGNDVLLHPGRLKANKLMASYCAPVLAHMFTDVQDFCWELLAS